jgi:hypothetical protein
MSELVSQDDRRRVLFEPTAQGVESALRRALSAEDGLPPARPAFDDGESLRRWDEVIAMRPQATAHAASSPAVDAIVVYRSTGPELQSRCTSALARQSYVAQRVLVADARASSVEAARGGALGDAEADWVVFLDETDLPEPKLLETLVRAQTASRADVVTCGLFLTGNGQGHAQHYFAGEPGALGLLSNGYGTVALLRRSLLDDLAGAWPTVGDPDWPLLARLSASGARIVSVPLPLVTRATPPASLERHASDALLVAEHLERVLPDSLRSLARLTVGLAADAVHRSAVPPERPNARQFRRVTGRLR